MRLQAAPAVGKPDARLPAWTKRAGQHDRVVYKRGVRIGGSAAREVKYAKLTEPLPVRPMTQQGAIARSLLRAQWQPMLFGPPNRARLAECAAEWPCRLLRVFVHRNHAIEPVTSAAAPYAAWNGLAYDWSIGPYDDSLSFEVGADPGIHLVWLETGRLSGLAGDALSSWLCERLRSLRAQTRSPILVLAWPLAPEVAQRSMPLRSVASTWPISSPSRATWRRDGWILAPRR